jgi:hypothetical protein
MYLKDFIVGIMPKGGYVPDPKEIFRSNVKERVPLVQRRGG